MSILTIILAVVFGPLQRFLETTYLDVQQWIICICVALSIIVASEIRRIILRRQTPAKVVPADGPAPNACDLREQKTTMAHDYAQRIGVDERTLTDTPVLDPARTVRTDVQRVLWARRSRRTCRSQVTSTTSRPGWSPPSSTRKLPVSRPSPQGRPA